MKLYRDKQGVKLYPVCNWELNQHKIYNAHDRAMNYCTDTNWCDKAVQELERVDKAMEAIDRYVINGMVYARYEDYKLLKDIISAYDARH